MSKSLIFNLKTLENTVNDEMIQSKRIDNHNNLNNPIKTEPKLLIEFENSNKSYNISKDLLMEYPDSMLTGCFRFN